jgi:RIO-like serine/threonine protein kinase
MKSVYYSSWGSVKGCDVVPQPVFGCPVWDGRNWLYVTIMEKVEGVVLSHVNSLSYRLWYHKQYNKSKALDAVVSTVTAFWSLGFSHNDLHWGNVIYDIKTNTAKLIDLETAVKMPLDNVRQMRRELSGYVIDALTRGNMMIDRLSELYNRYYKFVAISILYVASQYCQQYHDEDNRIYNTDDHLLPLTRNILHK